MLATMATIQLPQLLQDYAGGVREVEVAGATASEALENLFAAHPDLRVRLIDRRGRIRRHIQLFMDGKQLPRHDHDTIELEPDAQIMVLIAITGG